MFKEVTRLYDGQYPVTAVNSLSLIIMRGEFLCLAGPSGSGKTTVLNLMAGLDRPTQGSIIFDGQMLNHLSSHKLSRLRLLKIGFVFQELNLLPVLTAFENIEFPLVLQKVPASERKRRTLKIMQELEILDLFHRKPSAMSGGQQQRVAVARAVVTQPLLVLADEPTANLDSTNAVRLIELMHHLNQAHGITFVIATHDHQVISRAHRVIYLRDGQISSPSTKP
ncbi:MAG: ABC transporter ATP-binding protein [Candidatus Omnitrophica bacterium]|nr:ABC transporter ATP-binding protein [Candidatus Omnitrophota bacterium]